MAGYPDIHALISLMKVSRGCPAQVEHDASGMSRPRKVHVKSFGCQMNVYDSHRMADTLAPAGFTETADVRRRRSGHPQHLPHPRKGGRQGLFRDRPHPRVQGRGRSAQGRQMLIAVAGCVAQAEGEEIMRRAGAVDLVVGSQNYHRLPGLIARAAGAARRSSTPNFRSRTSSTSSPRRRAKRSPSAALPPSSPCRKAATSSAPSASCPIRAAPKFRGRWRRSSPKSSGWPRPACAK